LNKKILIFLILLGSSQMVFAGTEFWQQTNIKFPFRGNAKFNVIPEFRFRGRIGELYYFRTYIGPTLSLNKNFDASFYYAPNYSKTGENWTPGSLICLDGTYKNDLPWFTFTNRGRFEYDISPDVLKYRNLFQFRKDAWVISDEFFYNIKRGFFDEGRSLFAYSAKINGNTDLLLGYLLRRQKASPSSDWARTNVVNLGLKIEI